MTVIAAAIDALFADPNIAPAAIYAPADTVPFPVRVIARRADTSNVRLKRPGSGGVELENRARSGHRADLADGATGQAAEGAGPGPGCRAGA